MLVEKERTELEHKCLVARSQSIGEGSEDVENFFKVGKESMGTKRRDNSSKNGQGKDSHGI